MTTKQLSKHRFRLFAHHSFDRTTGHRAVPSHNFSSMPKATWTCSQCGCYNIPVALNFCGKCGTQWSNVMDQPNTPRRRGPSAKPPWKKNNDASRTPPLGGPQNVSRPGEQTGQPFVKQETGKGGKGGKGKFNKEDGKGAAGSNKPLRQLPPMVKTKDENEGNPGASNGTSSASASLSAVVPMGHDSVLAVAEPMTQFSNLAQAFMAVCNTQNISMPAEVVAALTASSLTTTRPVTSTLHSLTNKLAKLVRKRERMQQELQTEQEAWHLQLVQIQEWLAEQESVFLEKQKQLQADINNITQEEQKQKAEIKALSEQLSSQQVTPPVSGPQEQLSVSLKAKLKMAIGGNTGDEDKGPPALEAEASVKDDLEMGETQDYFSQPSLESPPKQPVSAAELKERLKSAKATVSVSVKPGSHPRHERKLVKGGIEKASKNEAVPLSDDDSDDLQIVADGTVAQQDGRSQVFQQAVTGTPVE